MNDWMHPRTADIKYPMSRWYAWYATHTAYVFGMSAARYPHLVVINARPHKR